MVSEFVQLATAAGGQTPQVPLLLLRQSARYVQPLDEDGIVTLTPVFSLRYGMDAMQMRTGSV